MVHSLPISGQIRPEKTPLILGGNGNSRRYRTFPLTHRRIVLYNRALAPGNPQLAAGALF